MNRGMETNLQFAMEVIVINAVERMNVKSAKKIIDSTKTVQFHMYAFRISQSLIRLPAFIDKCQ